LKTDDDFEDDTEMETAKVNQHLKANMPLDKMV
jgi:hypothetical protein